MTVEAASPDELARVAHMIDRWAAGALAAGGPLVAVDHDAEACRWYLRMRGEDKEFITVWLTLAERTLRFETYFMPAPEENVEALWEYLLRVNARLFAMRFALGDEDAVYLLGQLPVSAVDEPELDRILGASWAYCEQYFRPAMSIGYASRYRPRR